jgi:hypothetical protein
VRGSVHSAFAWLTTSSSSAAAFFAHAYREADVVGIAADQAAQPHRIGELARVRLEVQRDAGTALRQRHRLHGELAVGAGLPVHAGFRGRARLARAHRDTLGDDERRVEPDAELADERRGFLLVPGQGAEEFRRARAGDSAEVGDGFGARHADAVVADGHRAGVGVGVDRDAEVGVVAEQPAVGDGREAQPVAGIRRIGDQLAQEDLPVAVQGVDHELQQLTHLGLKAVRLSAGAAGRGGVRAGDRCRLGCCGGFGCCGCHGALDARNWGAQSCDLGSGAGFFKRGGA